MKDSAIGSQLKAIINNTIQIYLGYKTLQIQRHLVITRTFSVYMVNAMIHQELSDVTVTVAGMVRCATVNLSRPNLYASNSNLRSMWSFYASLVHCDWCKMHVLRKCCQNQISLIFVKRLALGTVEIFFNQNRFVCIILNTSLSISLSRTSVVYSG